MSKLLDSENSDSLGRALFGGLLQGNRWVRQALIDEAGINAKDPVVVVAGLVLDPDRDYHAIKGKIETAVERELPAHLQDDFYFHAKDVYGKIRKQEGWSWADCNRITDAWLDIAIDLKIPVVLTWIAKNLNERGVCEVNDDAHMVAFAECAQGIDDFMRAHAPDEIASLIVEDCPQMRSKLRHMIQKIQRGDLVGKLNFSERITNTADGLLFGQKQDHPFLQIADAFAWSFSRYANDRKGGSRFWLKMNGSPQMMASLNIPNTGGGRVLIWPS